MKDVQKSQPYFAIAAKVLNFTEYRVFTIWFLDAPKFSAGATLLHQRMPFIDRPRIAKALKSLEKKEFIKTIGYRKNSQGSPTPLYELNESCLELYKHTTDPQSMADNTVKCDSPNIEVCASELSSVSSGAQVLDNLNITRDDVEHLHSLNFNSKKPKVENSLANDLNINSKILSCLDNVDKKTEDAFQNFLEILENGKTLTEKQIGWVLKEYKKLTTTNSKNKIYDDEPVIRPEMDRSMFQDVETTPIMSDEDYFAILAKEIADEKLANSKK